MNFLVTGAGGYLGQEVVRRLLKDPRHRIAALSRSGATAKAAPLPSRVHAIAFDLKRLVAGEDIPFAGPVDGIIHLAARVRVDQGAGACQELMADNALVTAALLDWAQKKAVQRFIYASSMTVFSGLHAGDIMLKEDSPRGPTSFYGLSKLFGEEILRLYARQGKVKGVVLRFPGLFGGQRKSGLMYNLASRMMRHEDVELDLKGVGNWDFLHVRDAAGIVADLAERYPFDRDLEMFNAGYPDAMPLRRLIDRVRKHYRSGSSVVIRHEKDYVPCRMDGRRLKKWLASFPDRKAALGRFMQELAS